MEGVAGNAIGSLFGVAKEELSYMWYCFENIENLKIEVTNLEHMKGRVQQQIKFAESKGGCLLDGVNEWMEKANYTITDATKFIAKEDIAKKTCCNIRFCYNLGTLYHYGKTAVTKTSLIVKHQEGGKVFETSVSLPALTPRFTNLYRSRNLEDIDTQKSTLEKIIRAIEDDRTQIVGITGLGGVGKTTLASEVAEELKNQFADIVFIAVSQTIDTKMIQEKVGVAANKIINGQKVLIILDDVWEEFVLEEVGIPHRSYNMNCKILLTSRNKDVCVAMDAQKIISVDPLPDKEAWTLFQRAVGEREWDGNLEQVAWKIVQECGGLPLFVQTLGTALKNKEYNSWVAALDRLQDPVDEDAPYKRKGIMQLKLSYDHLESEVAKSCFLLCSMFPEDGTIGLKTLTYYVLGLQIFNNPESNIQEAKHRVQVVVDSLKSSFLLLPGREDIEEEEQHEEKFKMHDLIRDMAILITSKGNDKFWVRSGTGLTEWRPKKHLESYKKISLMGNKICKLHDHKLLFPLLDTFLIQDNELSIVPDEFFQSMEKLKVLDMSRNKISSLPQSLKQLTELRMLDLSENKYLLDISICGELTCLEILKLRRTGITSIPQEIGKLISLRLLDVFGCEDLSYVAPGVISKLIWLEELYIELKKGNCNFVPELSELKLLKILHLQVPDLRYIPEDFHFESLIEFHIKDGTFKYQTHGCKRILEISKISFPFTMPIMKLIHLSEVLRLWNIKDLYNILPDLYRAGFEELKYIELMGCGNVRSLVMTYELNAMQTSNRLGPMRTKGKFFSQLEEIRLFRLNRLEVLWDSTNQHISFCNLAKIKIDYCSSLLELFPLSVAQRLTNLRKLDISYCESLVVVISSGHEQNGGYEYDLAKQDTGIVFPLLTNIRLRQLANLESFYSGHSVIKYPCLKSLKVSQCGSMKRWSYGENYIPNITFDHQGRLCSNINEYINEMIERSSFWNFSK